MGEALNHDIASGKPIRGTDTCHLADYANYTWSDALFKYAIHKLDKYGVDFW